jgi:hypothetical protein
MVHFARAEKELFQLVTHKLYSIGLSESRKHEDTARFHRNAATALPRVLDLHRQAATGVWSAFAVTALLASARLSMHSVSKGYCSHRQTVAFSETVHFQPYA